MWWGISGIEAAVHAVGSALKLDENEAVLLADARNALYSLNRQVPLHKSKEFSLPYLPS